MECFDVSNAMHALVGASLIVAGSMLMTQSDKVGRGFGAYAFAFGYLLLGLAASGQTVGKIDVKSRRYMLGIASVIAIVAGHFMVQYHVQDAVSKAVKDHMAGYPVLQEDIIRSIPVIDNVLIYAGYAGLIATIAMKKDGSFDLVKGALALGAVLVMGYTRDRYVKAMVSGESVDNHKIAHILSYGLLVLAISYKC